MLRLLLVLSLLITLASDIVRAQPVTRAVEYCAQECHRWLIEDPSREAIADIRLPTTGLTHRVRYAADWLHSEPCPQGRLQVARGIVGTKESTAFSPVLIGYGFCPRVTIDGVAPDAPYFVSGDWDELVLDNQRSQLLTREDYERHAVPAIQRIFASTSPHRWTTFALVVATGAETHTDLLVAEIRELFADPVPSTRQESGDGGSSKSASVRRVADAIDRNPAIVKALLDDLDANPSLSGNPGYRRMLHNLAGISSSVPTCGSPPVCADVDRIARHLPWERDDQADAKFLATLSRCDTGSENLLRRSLQDRRPVVAATAMRVWSMAASSGRSAGRHLLPDVVELVTTRPLPDAGSVPVYLYGKQAQRLVTEGTPIEHAALGLSALGELSRTVERLQAGGKAETARALLDGAERAIQRLYR